MILHHGQITTQELPEVKLHYVEVEHDENAPLVLLLHGFPENWSAWKKYFAPLAENGYHPVALDLRGYNDSSKPKGIKHYDLEYLIQDIHRVVKHFNRPTYIVGHDWGGIIAMNFVEKYPEFCQGLVIMNAPHTPTLFRNMKNDYKFAFKQMSKFWYTAFFQIPWLPEVMLKVLKFDKHIKKGVTSPLNYYRANLFKLTKKQHQFISSPTLLIWGEEDIVLDKKMTEGMESFFTQKFEKHYLAASHWVHRECTQEVLELMLTFFKSLKPQII